MCRSRLGLVFHQSGRLHQFVLPTLNPSASNAITGLYMHSLAVTLWSSNV